MGLNGTQKNILDSVLPLYLDAIVEGIENREETIKAFELVFDPEPVLTPEKTAPFEKYGVCGDIKLLHRIMTSPCPQNGTTSDINVIAFLGGVINGVRMEGNISPDQKDKLLKEAGVGSLEEYMEGHVIYSRGANNDPDQFCREVPGILSLTGRNDNTAEPVTRKDVTDYLTAEVTRRRTALLSPEKAAKQETEQQRHFKAIRKFFDVQPHELYELYEKWHCGMRIDGEWRHGLETIVNYAGRFHYSGATFGQMCDLYQQNQLGDVAGILLNLDLKKCGLAYDVFFLYYQHSPQKVRDIAFSSPIKNLMTAEYNVSFQEVSRQYDRDPERLEAIASNNTICALIKDHGAKLEQLGRLHTESPEMLKTLASPTVRGMMKEGNVPLTYMITHYDKLSEKLPALTLLAQHIKAHGIEKMAELSVAALQKLTQHSTKQLLNKGIPALDIGKLHDKDPGGFAKSLAALNKLPAGKAKEEVDKQLGRSSEQDAAEPAQQPKVGGFTVPQPGVRVNPRPGFRVGK